MSKPINWSLASNARFKIYMSIVVTAAVMFLATLRGDRVSDRWTVSKVVLSAPLEFLRNQSLLLIGALLLFLLILNIRAIVKGRIAWAVSIIALLLLNSGLMLRDYSANYLVGRDLVLGVGAYIVLALCFGVSSRRGVAEATDRCMLTLVLAFVPFAAASLFEATKNLDNVMWNGRFNGATSHPVFCGVISGLASVAAAHLILSRSLNRMLWIVAGVTLLLGVAFVILSGTRTALVVISVASIGVMWEHFRKRSGLWIAGIAFAIVFIAGYSAFKLLKVEEVAEDARIASMQNTREEAWSGLWEIFRQNPLTGTPGVGGESSYLLAAASGGLVGLVPFMIAISALVVSICSMLGFAKRFSLGASLASMGIGLLFLGVFEGYMLDIMTYPFVALLIVASSLSAADKIPYSPPLVAPNKGGVR